MILRELELVCVEARVSCGSNLPPRRDSFGDGAGAWWQERALLASDRTQTEHL